MRRAARGGAGGDTSYKLDAASYKLQATGYKLQATGHKLQVTSHKPQVTIYCTIYKPRYKLLVTCDLELVTWNL